jgi:hypothetical protein
VTKKVKYVTLGSLKVSRTESPTYPAEKYNGWDTKHGKYAVTASELGGRIAHMLATGQFRPEIKAVKVVFLGEDEVE